MKSRIRTIKPQFFDDPTTGTLEPLARLLFIGLLTLADRRGRLADEPLRIQVRILPYDRVKKIDVLLDSLVAAGLIVRYTQDNQEVIWIKNFEKHQMVNHREPDSALPDYEEGTSLLRTGAHGHDQAHTGTHMGNGTERNGTERNGRERKGREDHLAVIDPRFERFWTAYPNKKAKAAAEVAWKKLSVDDVLLGTIVAAIDTQKTWRPWREGFIPHPATWLNAQRWLDEPEPARENPKSRTAGNADALRAVLERRRTP